MIADSNLPNWKQRTYIADAYPHIIHDTGQEVYTWPPRLPADNAAERACAENTWFRNDPKKHAIQQMLANLSGVGWRRISARFERTLKVGDEHRVCVCFRVFVLLCIVAFVCVRVHLCMSA